MLSKVRFIVPRRIAQAPVSKGFTLLEILVVLVIAGLTTGLVVPRLADLPQRLQTANERKQLLGQIEGLGYRAYMAGSSLTLRANPEAGDGPAAEAILDIPAGWKVSVDAPVRYSPNGICGGGDVALTSPRGDEERYRLAPPVCRPEPVEAVRS